MRHRKMGAGVIATSAIAILCVSALAQDDWHVVERRNTTPGNSGPAAQDARPAPAEIVVCGEHARAAGEPYQSIVNQINEVWGSRIRVYESIERSGPHASSGGCIFYNRAYLETLLGQWMNVQDAAANPMLFAIFAHEVGHQVHGDTEGGARPARERELAADRFAGFTLERLGIQRLDPAEVTQYYQLTGDDFTGGDGTHGSGADRAAAFADGWHRAEMGLREPDAEPAGGLGEP